MRNLIQLLRDSDRGRLLAIADSWNVGVRGLQDDEMRQALNAALLEEGRAQQIWRELSEDQRMILITLITTEKGEMSKEMFGRFYGEINRLGFGQIQREKPQNSDQAAQALYYRGLIGDAYERDDRGTRQIIYVPLDLGAVLPTYQTSYQLDEGDRQNVTSLSLEAITEVEYRIPADTTIVDDLTTLLAYWQREPLSMKGHAFSADERKRMGIYLQQQEERRMDFLFQLAQSGQLLQEEESSWVVHGALARPWLQSNRHQQVKQLAQIWRDSTLYRELWQIPELRVDRRAGDMPSFNAAAARSTLLELLEKRTPKNDWWLVEDFIELVKQESPDFQRANYDRWYIQNEEGEYLSGYEHWDEIEGRVLEFILTGPMHWLGLLDTAEQAARFTAYGRAFLGREDWPDRSLPEADIEVDADGSLLIPRRMNQLVRFQLARFCEWGVADDPYAYRITPESLAAAQEKDITLDQIRAFLLKLLQSEALPAVLLPMFSNERGGSPPELALERKNIIRTSTTETMEFIFETPTLRRYLEERIGPRAAIVLPRKESALRQALQEEGIHLPSSSG